MRLLALLLIVGPVFGQGFFGGARDPRWQTVGAGALASRPAACAGNKHVWICNGTGCGTNGTYHYCTADNTWTVSVGGGGGVSATVDLTDFKPTVAGHTLTVQAGRARIGNYAPATIALGTVHFNDASGSGDVKVFIDSGNNLVCLAQTGVTHSVTGSMTCSNVATPAYPANSIPIADLAITTGSPPTVAIDADDRAFLATRGVSAGTGISIGDSGGVASIGIDTATVPLLGAPNAWTGANDFTAATNFYIRRGSGAPASGECDAAAEVGQLYARSDAEAAASTLYICSKTGASTYAWEIAGSGGGGGAPTGAQYLTLATDAGLSAERVLTPGDALAATDAGANGAYTIDWNPLDRTVSWVVDEFRGGGASVGGGVGDNYFWGRTGAGTCTLAYQTGVANHPGILRATTAAAGNDHCYLEMRTGADILPRLDNVAGWDFQAIFSLPSVANVGFYFGPAQTSYVWSGADTFRVKFDTDDSDAVFKFQTCAASTCTTVSSSVAPSAGAYHRARIRSTTAGTILFSIDGETEVSSTTNLPTSTLSPAIDVRTRTTAAKSVDIDWYAHRIRGLSR